MKSILKSGILFSFIVLSVNTFAQIKNPKTQIVKVYGNCEMCKEIIESAINKNDVAFGNWDTKTKLLTVKYDAAQTDINQLLKKIAQAGYDNAVYTAPEKAYKNLPQCCQYKRPQSSTKKSK